MHVAMGHGGEFCSISSFPDGRMQSYDSSLTLPFHREEHGVSWREGMQPRCVQRDGEMRECLGKGN